MDPSLRGQIDSYLRQLDGLIRRGRQIHEKLVFHPSDAAALAENRAWQQDIGVTVNQLSGGSKAHWLAHAFSEAFLLRSLSGEIVETVHPAEIVERLVGVLEQGAASLNQMLSQTGDRHSISAAPDAAIAPRRFEFVHNVDLRRVLEQAYAESRRALDEGKYAEALLTLCGILESIVTDALEYKGVNSLADGGIPQGPVSEWAFETRLAVAESAGLIRGGWARLPEVARKYREVSDAEGGLKLDVSEQDARRTMQVLHIVMRDLDPGR